MPNLDADALSTLLTVVSLLGAAILALLMGRRSPAENLTERPLDTEYQRWLNTPKK